MAAQEGAEAEGSPSTAAGDGDESEEADEESSTDRWVGVASPYGWLVRPSFQQLQQQHDSPTP